MPCAARASADINDGGWHMITLSTFANGTKGYTLYIDGRWVGRPACMGYTFAHCTSLFIARHHGA